MAIDNAAINALVGGITSSLTDKAQKGLEDTVRRLSRDLEMSRQNVSYNMLSNNHKSNIDLRNSRNVRNISSDNDTQAFTTISELINGSNKDIAGFGTMMDNLYAKNKKYFTIIKDYEIMPILIPQINRVLDFLVNECLSPDVQNDNTFTIKYIGESNAKAIQADIDQIKKKMKLDTLLREVYTNRYKLGREYYLVQDYEKTFTHMLEMLKKKKMNEAATGMPESNLADSSIFSEMYPMVSEHISTLNCNVVVPRVLSETTNKLTKSHETVIGDSSVTFNLNEMVNLEDLNIIIERSQIVKAMEECQAELLHESYNQFTLKNMLKTGTEWSLNEDGILGGMSYTAGTQITDYTKLEQIVNSLKRKKIQRCTITRLDPARVFKLKLSGRTIGYFYVSDISDGIASTVNFSQSLKDQLLKSRATNLNASSQSVEDIIAKELANKIINKFDPNIGISRIEDIDLLHDFIKNNDIYKGNKRITFYYDEEIYDMSRTNESILTNAVFFTKLYATLILNNIITKVIRGRGRQIHTVRMGASLDVRRYLDNAMASLVMPETNLGIIHGSFEQVMNPFNGSSDIVIPTEEDGERYITTDWIPGQDIDMNDETLKMILNSIITSFGLDASVVDTVNGNVQFARTLTMESLQIANAIRNEQQDTHDPWERMCLEVLHIMGNEALRSAIDNGQVEVSFYEPKTLIIQNIIEDLNNAKSLAENIADIIPMLNVEGTETLRTKFVYMVVKESTNLDFTSFEKILDDIGITNLDDDLTAKIMELIRSYKDNTKEVQYGDDDNDGIVAGDDSGAGYNTGIDDSDLTDEEKDILSTDTGDEDFSL